MFLYDISLQMANTLYKSPGKRQRKGKEKAGSRTSKSLLEIYAAEKPCLYKDIAWVTIRASEIL